MRQPVTEINIISGQCLVIVSYSGLVLFHQDNGQLLVMWGGFISIN